MRRAIEEAKKIHGRYGTDVTLITEELGLSVIEEDLEGRLREVYFGDSIVIRRDLPEAEKRELIAHAIGHHLLHAGNHLAMQNRVYSFGNYHERQANVFVAFLLMPEKELEDRLYEGIATAELADAFEVNESLAEFRLKLRTARQETVTEKS